MTGASVVAGDVNDDIVVRPSGDRVPDSDTPSLIARTPGGSAANQAVWLAALGVPVRLAGRVAASDHARLTAALGAAGVEAVLGADSLLPTGTVVVVVGAGGSRDMYTDRGANAALGVSDLPLDLLDGAGHLHVSAYALAGAPARGPVAEMVAAAVASGVPVTLDPASEAELRAWPTGPADLLAPAVAAGPLAVILPNLAEGRALTGVDDPCTVARSLLDVSSIVALKLGAAGAVVADRAGQLIEMQPTPTEVIDPTGAGDAFAAGFLAAWRAGSPLAECAAAGCAAGARAVQVAGARPAT